MILGSKLSLFEDNHILMHTFIQITQVWPQTSAQIAHNSTRHPIVLRKYSIHNNTEAAYNVNK